MRQLVRVFDRTLDDLDETIKKSPELTEANSGDDTHKHPLLKIYDELNNDGQDRMKEYAQFLSSQPQYKKCQDISDEKIG